MRVLLALWLALAPVKALAGSMTLLGAGGGAAAVVYLGPGDVYTTAPYAWYSCARAFSASYAASGGSLCELQRTSDNTKCTIVAKTNGFADLTTTSCTTGTQTIVQFCNATTCGVDEAFDQTGNARHLLQATQASQPTITFNSTPTGTLPAINCTGTTLLATSATFTQAQPLAFSLVANRNGTVQPGGTLGANTGTVYLGGSSGANQAVMIAGGTGVSATVADNAWHALNGLANGNLTSSALNVDGSDTTGAAGTTGFSANNIRLCRANASEFLGLVAEAGIWASATISTDRSNISTNQHSANGYNF